MAKMKKKIKILKTYYSYTLKKIIKISGIYS